MLLILSYYLMSSPAQNCPPNFHFFQCQVIRRDEPNESVFWQPQKAGSLETFSIVTNKLDAPFYKCWIAAVSILAVWWVVLLGQGWSQQSAGICNIQTPCDVILTKEFQLFKIEILAEGPHFKNVLVIEENFASVEVEQGSPKVIWFVIWKSDGLCRRARKTSPLEECCSLAAVINQTCFKWLFWVIPSAFPTPSGTIQLHNK